MLLCLTLLALLMLPNVAVSFVYARLFAGDFDGFFEPNDIGSGEDDPYDNMSEPIFISLGSGDGEMMIDRDALKIPPETDIVLGLNGNGPDNRPSRLFQGEIIAEDFRDNDLISPAKSAQISGVETEPTDSLWAEDTPLIKTMAEEQDAITTKPVAIDRDAGMTDPANVEETVMTTKVITRAKTTKPAPHPTTTRRRGPDEWPWSRYLRLA